jgi:hypothetical protein
VIFFIKSAFSPASTDANSYLFDSKVPPPDDGPAQPRRLRLIKGRIAQQG